jgi:hypothetical protein
MLVGAVFGSRAAFTTAHSASRPGRHALRTFPCVIPQFGRPGFANWHDDKANMRFCGGHVPWANQAFWIAPTDASRRLWNNDTSPTGSAGKITPCRCQFGFEMFLPNCNCRVTLLGRLSSHGVQMRYKLGYSRNFMAKWRPNGEELIECRLWEGCGFTLGPAGGMGYPTASRRPALRCRGAAPGPGWDWPAGRFAAGCGA